jgi:hypothetical protein
MGHVVGFLGDGVNDAPAMHAADTSVSVAGAVDVAREAADFVLLERHLDVIRRGIEEGRKMFANTLKYVLTTMSANLGNMVDGPAAGCRDGSGRSRSATSRTVRNRTVPRARCAWIVPDAAGPGRRCRFVSDR